MSGDERAGWAGARIVFEQGPTDEGVLMRLEADGGFDPSNPCHQAAFTADAVFTEWLHQEGGITLRADGVSDEGLRHMVQQELRRKGVGG